MADGCFSKAQVRRQSLNARQVVRRREDIDVRKCGLHPARERPVGRIAEQRIEPDDAPGAAAYLTQRRAEDRWVAGVPAIAQYDDGGAPIEQAWPPDAQVLETLADLRAT